MLPRINTRFNHPFTRLFAMLGLFYLWQSVSAQTPANISLSNLVMYLPLNNNLQDYSNHNNSAQSTTETEFYAGKVDQALLCNGNAYAVGLADNLPTQQRTVGLWFYPFNINHVTLFAYGGGATASSFVLALNPGGVPGVDYNFYVVHPYGSGLNAFKDYYGAPNGSVVTLSGWHHWVVTTNETGTCNYINGQRTSCNPSLFFNTTDVAGKQYALCAAVSPQGLAPYQDANFNNFFGLIDELMVYDIALTEADVLQLFESATPKTSTVRLMSSTAEVTSTMMTSSSTMMTSTMKIIDTTVKSTNAIPSSTANISTTNYIVGAAIGSCIAGSLFGVAVGFFAVSKCRHKKNQSLPVDTNMPVVYLADTEDYSKIPAPAPIVYENWHTTAKNHP